MKKLILLLLFAYAFVVHAQDVEVIQKFDSVRTTIFDVFIYLEDQTDSSRLNHVAVIQASSDTRDGIENLYTFAKNKALDLGANCYRVLEFEHRENGMRIILDLYYADAELKKIITAQQPQNTVFVLGSDNPTKVMSCRVNNAKIELFPFTYYRQENTRGQEIKVSKGGITGMAVWVTWEENKPARYITLSGFGISGGGVSPAGGAGIGFNTGRLSYIDTDFGRFLSVVMKPITVGPKK